MATKNNPENPETEITTQTTPEQAEQVQETAQDETPAEPSAEELLTAQLKEEQDRHLRLMAEFDNFRRRTAKEKESIYPDAVAETVKALLPTLDNFKRALEAPCSDEEYRKGVRMTYDGFMEALKKLGLEEYGTAGDPFDPNLHNAVMHLDDDSLEKNVVAQVLQCGYRIKDRVLRYAMVQQAN